MGLSGFSKSGHWTCTIVMLIILQLCWCVEDICGGLWSPSLMIPPAVLMKIETL